ncbi:hypothetical protein M422DRAFT_779290 [Sphaerobolus stellatus SS14]|uniref:F-box domain-containing protein n=1 Tax=Sphaerobolus stellatus (strain SS14) TaxID=990650 RepID=A0A0C9VZV4_SPHS4|nr:hypothetical protein M422DRAFT_779290 [Sphaerobolus stellatus SS14]
MFDVTSNHEHQLSLSSQPFDILDRIAFAIENPRDILALGLTSRQSHDIVFPEHIEYRNLSCHLNRTEIWEILRTNPGLACRFYHLAINEDKDLQTKVTVDTAPSAWGAFQEREPGPGDFGGMRLAQAVTLMHNLVHFSWTSAVKGSQADDIMIATMLALSRCPLLEIMDIQIHPDKYVIPTTNFESVLSSVMIPLPYLKLKKLRLDMVWCHSKATVMPAFFLKLLQSSCPELVDLYLSVDLEILTLILQMIALKYLTRLSFFIRTLFPRQAADYNLPWSQFLRRHPHIQNLITHGFNSVSVEALTKDSFPNLRNLNIPVNDFKYAELQMFSQEFLRNVTCIDGFDLSWLFTHCGHMPRLKILNGRNFFSMLFTISHYAPNLERIGPSIPDRAPCLIAYEDAISALTKSQYLTHRSGFILQETIST